MDGADDYLLSIDSEFGLILRFSERLGGEEFYSAEVSELTFDDAFPEGTFHLDLPEA